MNDCTCPTEAETTRTSAEILHRPRVTTTEDEQGVTLHVALPAVARHDLRLSLLESNLRIDARRNNAVPEGWKALREGSAPQRYRLDVRLNARFDGTRAKATLDAGVLTLRVPVREEAKPRPIEVN